MVEAADGIPESICAALTAAAQDWRESPARPRPTEATVRYWDELVDGWVRDPRNPLLVRRSGNRGCEESHRAGRTIVCVDNSPAHWTLACAIADVRPTAAELLQALESGEWPVVFAMKKAETARRPRYSGLLGRSVRGRTLNAGAWKVCHIEEVGLGTRGAVSELPLPALIEASRRLLSPSNMFLVPNSHAGFGELPEVVGVFRREGGKSEFRGRQGGV